MKRIRRIYRLASEGGREAYPTDWLGHNAASKYKCNDGENFEIDWYKTYDGVRLNFEWMN